MGRNAGRIRDRDDEAWDRHEDRETTGEYSWTYDPHWVTDESTWMPLYRVMHAWIQTVQTFHRTLVAYDDQARLAELNSVVDQIRTGISALEAGANRANEEGAI